MRKALLILWVGVSPLAAWAQSEESEPDPFAEAERQMQEQQGAASASGSIGLCGSMGCFGLLALIVVPLVIRSARKGKKQAAQYNQGPPPSMGLVKNGSSFTGVFQGFPAAVTPHFDFNFAGFATNMLHGKGLSKSAMGMGRQTFYHRYEFTLNVPGAAFPATAFYEKDWWGMFGNVEYQRRKPQGEKLSLQSGKLDVYGTDPQFAAALLGNSEFLTRLSQWPYTNLQVAGDTITLELMHHWNEIESKFGREAMMSWKFAEVGLNVMTALARAASAIQPPGR